MSNNYFRFKQFTIYQDNCAMKVCTDACLFGAWMAEKAKRLHSKVKMGLDIGTGTGLLSLMLAGQTDAIIDAVEIDEAAAKQATENFASSPWKEKLRVHKTSIQEFGESKNQCYDLIISNPPFFENDLKSDDHKRNLALHSAELSLEELLKNIKRLLKEDGCFALLLPYHRSNYFEQLALAEEYCLHEKVLVRQTSKHNYFRSMLLFARSAAPLIQKEIVIRMDDGKYSPEFIDLLKAYYLFL